MMSLEPTKSGAAVKDAVLEIASREAAARPSLAQLQIEKLVASMGISPQNFLMSFELSAAVAEQGERFEKMIHRCQREFSADSVHDARVHCRRLIARLLLVEKASPAKGLEPAIRSLKRLLKSLGELRDVQVQKIALAAELSRYPEVGGLWIELGRRERELIILASDSLSEFKLGKMRRRLEEIQTSLKNPAARLAAKAVLGESIKRATQTAFDEVVKRACAIDPEEVSTVHRVRTAYKKFRYMVESLPPSAGRPSETQFTSMAAYQQAMGSIQDVDVLLRFLADFTSPNPKLAWSLEPFRMALIDRRNWLVNDFVAQAETIYSFWPLRSAPVEILQTAAF